jgi:hypothetical protein
LYEKTSCPFLPFTVPNTCLELLQGTMFYYGLTAAHSFTFSTEWGQGAF